MSEVGAPLPGKEQVSRTRTWITALAGLLALALLAVGCAGGPEEWPGFFPTGSTSPDGRSVESLYIWVFVIAVAIFLLVEGLLLWIVLRYRRRPADDALPPQTHGNNFLEAMWTFIPALIVTGLFIATVTTLTEVEHLEAEPQGLVIEVTAFRFQWTFAYPNEGLSFTGAGAEGPVLAVPVNERVRVQLNAIDVIHSFYVPMFRYKKDAIPGRINEFDFVVDQEGTYTGQCAEFCGLLHYQMFFTVQAMSRADYDAWVAEQQQAAQQTPQPSPPPEAPTVEVTAISTTEGFRPTELTAPADTPWVVELTNEDPLVPHDFAIREANPDGTDWQGDPDAEGGGSATYQPPPLAAGQYEFFCSLHPNMIGTLNVGP